jgi:TPR repeat protein
MNKQLSEQSTKYLNEEQNDIQEFIDKFTCTIISHGDVKQYFQIITKLADDSNPYGQAFLGYCYYNGYVVQQNIEHAIELYKLSVSKNNHIGQGFLGDYYIYLYAGKSTLNPDNKFEEGIRLLVISVNKKYILALSNLKYLCYNTKLVKTFTIEQLKILYDTYVNLNLPERFSKIFDSIRNQLIYELLLKNTSKF